MRTDSQLTYHLSSGRLRTTRVPRALLMVHGSTCAGSGRTRSIALCDPQRRHLGRLIGRLHGARTGHRFGGAHARAVSSNQANASGARCVGDRKAVCIGGVIHGAAVIFFAYLGFEAVSTAGAEARNPARDMPIGILGSLIVCTVLYIATAAVLVGIVPYAELDNAAPLAVAANRIGLPWFAFVVKIVALAGLSSVMLVLLYGQTRIRYAMSRDGLPPKSLTAVHKAFKTPWISTIVVGLVAMGAAGYMSLDALSDLTNVGSLAAFALVCATAIYMRTTSPDLARPFRTPWYPLTPIVGGSVCFVLLMSLMSTPDTRRFFLIYLAGGIVVYFAYGFRRSTLEGGILVPAQALLKHAVFLLEVLDHVQLMSVDPTDEYREEHMKRRKQWGHYSRV